MKLNNMTSYKMVDKLYEASSAGVPVQLMIRGICCLIPGVKGMSENIEVVGVVDRFLEHSRVYIFENDASPLIYISSADINNISYADFEIYFFRQTSKNISFFFFSTLNE